MADTIDNSFKQPNKKGTGFVNLSRFLDANRNNRLGQAVGSGISGTAQQARQGVQQSQSQFQTGLEKNRLDTESNKTYRSGVIGNIVNAGREVAAPGSDTTTPAQPVTQSILKDVGSGDTRTDEQKKTLEQFSKFRAGGYLGPRELGNQAELFGRSAEGEALGGAISSGGGRLALLQRFVGGKDRGGYTGGQQRLDELLLGQAGDQLRGARKDTLGLNRQVSEAAQAANIQAGEAAERNRLFGQETVQEVTGARDPLSGELQTRVNLAKAQEEARKTASNKILELLNMRGVEQIVDPTTNAVLANAIAAPKNDSEAIQRALEVAANSGFLDSASLDSIENLIRKSKTPIDKMIEVTTGAAGNAGLFGYGGAKKGQTFSYSSAPVTPTLNPRTLLRDVFERADALGLDRYGIAGDEDVARLNALSELAGQDLEFAGPQAKYRSGAAGFNVNRANQMLDENIAGLKGQKLTIDDTTPIPFIEQLRRTAAPTLGELGEDVKGDLSKAFASDADATERAAALLRLSASPIRAGIGVPLELGSSTLGNIGEGVSNILGSGSIMDRIGGVAQVVTAPIASVVSSVGGLFCYAEGTLIQMADGEWKKVEDIKIGDKCMLGGEVLGNGEVATPDIYLYKDQLLSGSHAVFEDGKFIRAKDSKLAKKYKNDMEIKLCPVVNKNHLLVTKTHISADYAEVDAGTQLTDDERLDIINKNKNLLELLSLAERRLDGK